METFTLDLNPIIELTDEQFYQICQHHDNYHFERSAAGELIIQEKCKFPPLCPDFVVELLSATDSLKRTRAKMQEYMENGAKLGWLIDRSQQKVEIYRQGKEVETIDSPQSLSGEDILPELTIDLTRIIP